MHLSFDNYEPLYMKTSQCMADNPHSLLIQPDGGFCRFEHENVLDRYGSLEEGITDSDKLENWKRIKQSSENCPECCLYPACYKLENCMNGDFPCTEELQYRNIERQKEKVSFSYIHKMEESNHEDI